LDSVLAILRRKMSGRPLSSADDQHIHHQVMRAVGGVKRAVFALYGIAAAFAVLGVTLAVLVMTTQLRVRFIYAMALVLFSFVGVIAFKAARRQQLELQMQGRLAPRRESPPAKPAPPAPAAAVRGESGVGTT
jgi:UDP-GlcNAc:undecaprenyl-phosphate GlcNAc-1-phosphate transferase